MHRPISRQRLPSKFTHLPCFMQTWPNNRNGEVSRCIRCMRQWRQRAPPNVSTSLKPISLASITKRRLKSISFGADKPSYSTTFVAKGARPRVDATRPGPIGTTRRAGTGRRESVRETCHRHA